MSDNIKIKINEIDTTTARPYPETADIVYIPGLSPNKDGSNINVAKKYTSLASFEADFETTDGDQVSKTYYTYSTTDAQLGLNFIEERKIDISYLYAKNILAAGLTIYYECVRAQDDNNTFDEFNLPVSTSDASEGVTFADKKIEYTITKAGDSWPTKDGTVNVIIPVEKNYAADSLEVTFTGSCSVGTIITTSNLTGNKETDGKTVTYTFDSEDRPNSADYICIPLTVTAPDTSSLEDAVTTASTEITLSIKLYTDGHESIDSKVASFYAGLTSALERLLDKNNYTIKYITSGGYPVFGTSYDIPKDSQDNPLNPIYKEMLKIASTRGDAIALIDHAYDEELPLDPSEDTSIYKKVCAGALTDGDGAGYGAMFTPWSVYGDGQLFPASYAYLTCLARAIKTNPNFLAIAGVARGNVSGIKNLAVGKQVLTSTIAENYQPKGKPQDAENPVYSINAITNIQPYGLTIWGNRTLAPIDGSEPTAKNFLNTRCMLCDIKKVAYTTAKTLMFEQDSDTLWLRFKSGVSGLLEQLKLGYGIRDYKILRKAESRRGHMSATIQVYPLYAIEYFEIDVLVSDEAVAVE